MYSFLRPFLFAMNAETAHAFTLHALHWLPSFCFKKPFCSPIQAMGLQFAHPIGLAAGLDKNGEHLEALAKLGFSFIEIGTTTPRPQVGNPKPRLFRLPEASALINRMGFNNAGVEVLVDNVKRANYQGILGINIGKNKDTALTHAVDDYLYCLRKVYEYASYVTINVSSPNTPDLRRLQEQDFFNTLMQTLHSEQQRLADKHQRLVPLVVKLSPDEADETLKGIAEAVLQHNIAGIIASNTTLDRAGVAHLPYAQEQGGLSGPPLFAASTRCLSLLKKYVGEAVSLIGVGGIDSASHATEKWQAGASLLQIYTGLIYQGPQLIIRLTKAFREMVGESAI